MPTRTREDKFTSALHNPDLSWEAKGMLHYIYNLEQSGPVTFNDLLNATDAGKDKIRRIAKELIDFGYIEDQRNSVKERINYVTTF